MGHSFQLPLDSKPIFYDKSEPIFFDEKVKDYWILGRTLEVRTRFHPRGAASIIFDETKEDYILHPKVTLEYRLLYARSEKQAKRHGIPVTPEQYEEWRTKRIREEWEKLSKQNGKKPAITFEEFMACHDDLTSYQKMNLDEIPNIEKVLEYIEDSIDDGRKMFYIHVDAQMYFDYDFSQRPVDGFDVKEWNIYRELASIYGYSCDNSDRILIRKHNAVKQFYLSGQLDAELKFKKPNYEETEESPDGYIWNSFNKVYHLILTQNRDLYPSVGAFLAMLHLIGKLSLEWDYGRNSQPSLTKKFSKFFNKICNHKQTSAYTPVNGFLLLMVMDLGEDLLDKGAAKECGYCGAIFPFRTNKLYCSLVSEDRDCGKKARNQRYYIKKSLENPTEN